MATHSWFATGPYTRRAKRDQREVSHSTVVGDNFNKQGTLYMKLVLRRCEKSRYSHLPIKILKIYIRALAGLSHTICPDYLNTTTLSQAYVLGTAASLGMVGRTYI